VQRPQQLRARTSLAKERFILDQLAGVEGVRVPRVIAGGSADPGITYTLMSRMPGVALMRAGIAEEPRRRVLFDLGRMLRRIHGIEQQPLFDARLIPGDHTPTDVRWRFGNLFDEAVAAAKRAAQPWPTALEPERLARLAMRALPEVDQIVVLHSNPSADHAFVDPPSGQLNGLIDFGDAYFSHAVHDLRRFRHPADRAAVYAGYVADAPVSSNFEQTWRVACVLANLLALHDPVCREPAQAETSDLIAHMH
jgi:hygromycin-B 7''-O-kinase